MCPKDCSDAESDYFDLFEGQYKFPRSFFNRNKRAFACNEMRKLPKGSKILDVGCGNGSVSKELLGKYKIYGVDINPKSIKYCRKNYPGVYKLANIEEKIPFHNAFFDGIVFVETIEHLKRPGAALNELKRVTKAGGIIVITTPNYDSIKWKLVESLWYPLFYRRFQPKKDEVHPSKFGKKKFEELLNKKFSSVSVLKLNYGMMLCAVCLK